jgi:2-polyprenyl-6-methoxyphenol hydroxylase-like FAD-dependent oxidoreductase
MFRPIVWDRLREQAPLDEPVTESELRDAMVRIAGTDFGMSEMRWSSRFLSERRQVRRYRAGRVFLAGDAAHVHSPLGGQGMNTTIGDAMNLGWKLAEAVRGTAPAGLLDSYQAERHPVGSTVLRLTDAFNTLVLGTSAVRRVFRRVAQRHRDPILPPAGGASARRTADARRRLWPSASLRAAARGRFVLVTNAAFDIEVSGAACGVHGDPSLPAAILVRPDGYVAWASDTVPDEATIRDAVDRWTRIANPASRV